MVRKRTFDWEGVEYGTPEYQRLWRLANLEKSRAYHRTFDAKQFATKPEQERARRKRWIDANPEKTYAHQRVKAAIRSGALKKLPCLICDRFDYVVAHHEDYTKPLDVIWFCEPHHKAHHKNKKATEH